MELFNWTLLSETIFSGAASLYWEINFLLIIGWFLWFTVKKIFDSFHYEVPNKMLLSVTRILFILLLATPILLKQLPSQLTEELSEPSIELLSEWQTSDLFPTVESLPLLEPISNVSQQKSTNPTSFSPLPSTTTEPGFSWNWKKVFGVLLGLGFFVQLLLLLINLVKLHKTIQRSFLWKNIGTLYVYLSEEISIPFSTRILGKKQIVLPSSLLNSMTNLRISVAHEGQHHRNGDLLWIIFLEIIKVLCYWNPASYLWKNSFCQLQEFACDESLTENRAISSYQYGNCLLDVCTQVSSTHPQFSGVATMNMKSFFKFNQPSLLKRRIQMLTCPISIKNLKFKLWGISSSLLFSTFMVALLLNGLFHFSEQAFAETNPQKILIPSGSFIMGASPKEIEKLREFEWGQIMMKHINTGIEAAGPAHEVYLDSYYIDKYEVTNRQYNAFVETTGHGAPHEGHRPAKLDGLDQPVVNVTWFDAQAYCEWTGGRLPTEAEWEKAARGIEGSVYPWGNDWNFNKLQSAERIAQRPLANYEDWHAWHLTIFNNLEATAADVGSFPEGASPYGVMDMAGNVAEWTADWFDSQYYANSPKQNPAGPEKGTWKVIRGGAWDAPNAITNTWYRDKFIIPWSPSVVIGFRCVTPHE